jgi:carbohydrate-binding DOMON domain-containing protein
MKVPHRRLLPTYSHFQHTPHNNTLSTSNTQHTYTYTYTYTLTTTITMPSSLDQLKSSGTVSIP